MAQSKIPPIGLSVEFGETTIVLGSTTYFWGCLDVC